MDRSTDGRLLSQWLEVRAVRQQVTRTEQGAWKQVDVILPASLSARAALDRIETQIRINATDAGDFVGHVRIGVTEPYSEGWCKWTAAYLPGPPGPFPSATD